MRRQALLPIFFCAALLLGPAAACADEAEDAAQAFESLFGNDIRNARATPDARDDVELAGRILNAARKAQAQAAFVALLCEKAYELSGTTPAGYATAAAALELLAQTAADRAAWCAERLLEVRQKQFDAARGDEKKAAGEALLACLLPAAEAKEKSGALPEAAALCRRMQVVAAAIDSPCRAEIDARADALALKMKVARQIADVTAMLARDPRNVGAREGLVRLYLVDLDDPAGAARHLAGVADETLLKYVPAAAKGIEAAPEVACTELADWYRGLAETALPAAKAAMYARAKAYLARFLEIHPAQDLDRTRATLALAKIDEAAAKLATPARPTPKPPAPREKPAPAIQHWIDLLPLVDAARDCHEGSCEHKDGGLWVFSKANGRLTVPVVANGSYEARFAWKRTWGPGQVTLTLPAGSGDFTLVLGGVAGVFSGLERINGRGGSKNETTIRPSKFDNDRVYRVTAQVKLTGDRAEIAVQLDDQPFMSWNGPQSALSAGYAVAERGCFGLGLWGAGVQFSEARIKMLSGEARPLRPPPGGATKGLTPAKAASAPQQWIDLLALVDPAKDAASGTWQREGRSLVLAVSSGVARLTLPVVPAGDYEIEVLFNRAAGDDALGVLLPTGSSRVLALLSAGRGKAHGLAYVNGQHATTGETAYKPGTIQNNRDHRLNICVRTVGDQTAVSVVLDAVSIITWQGPQSALSQYENWALPNPQCLGLAASEGNKVTYLAVRLKMLSGEAKPLRP
jgi:hypothetical protein